MRGKSMPKLRRTPKVFASSYRPPTTSSSRSAARVSLSAWRPIFVVVAIVAGFGLLTRLPIFQLKSVSVEGVNNPETVTELKSLVGSSIFSGQISRTVERWLATDPALNALSCRRGIPDTLQCQASYRSGALVWKQSNGEFWVDINGRVFSARQPEQPAAIVVEDALATATIGGDVASTEIVELFLRLEKALTDRLIVVNRFYVVDAVYQPGVVIGGFTTSDGRQIQKEVRAVFAATESIEAQVRTLKQLLDNNGDQIAGQIDLRVPGYVYYR